MRRSASLLIPLSVIVVYYGFWTFVVIYAARRFPGLAEYMPMGGIAELAAQDTEVFEPRDP